MRLVFDIETNGLLDELNTIHSLCIGDLDTKQVYSCTDHDYTPEDESVIVLPIEEGLRMLMDADKVIGHNIIKFDIPAIQKVFSSFHIKREAIVDTLIWSRLIYPESLRDSDFKDRMALRKKLRRQYDEEAADEQLKARFPGQLMGSHGLEAWGYRLGLWKGDYSKEMKAEGKDPWAEWNPAMQAYCEQDIAVTRKLFVSRLLKANYSKRALDLERDFAVILAEMERNGFPFDREKAEALQHQLTKRHLEIKRELVKAFEPITETWTFTPKVTNGKLGYVKGQPVEKSKVIEFNPSSRQHIARWLKLKYGWKPDAYTETGQPMVDEKILKKLEYPEAKLLAESFLIDKRLGMLEGKSGKGLLRAAKLEEDGVWRIHGGVNTIGAVTRRCTHSQPNMAQIPATKVPYGKQFRELLCSTSDMVLLGWDASGLELRCFAHYMARYDGGAYTKIVLEGDIHWVHVQALGLVPDGTERIKDHQPHDKARDVAKRFIYAFLYGAGDEKIGEIVAPPGASAAKKKAEGKKLRATFLKKTPALKRLKDDLAAAIKARNGKLLAIDGGEMTVRSDHSALNTLLQSAGAIAVKEATIRYYDRMIADGLQPSSDFQIVAHVHDEVQTLVKKGKEDIVGQHAMAAMAEAGEALGFKCPLAAEYQVGASWADTH